MLQNSFALIRPSGKLALLLLLTAIGLLFSSLIGFLLLMPFLGTGILDALASPDYSNPVIVNALKAIQIINMIGGLLIPSLLYVWLTNGKAFTYLRLRSVPGKLLFLLVVVFIISAQPFISYTNEINSRLVLPGSLERIQHWMQVMEQQAQILTDAFITTATFPGLLLNLFMIAILPAIVEEIVFRGVLAQLFNEWTHSNHWAVVLSSLVFAGIHLQFFGFIPRFILGLSLGYIFFWTGNLWFPILGHFINNFLSVLAEYLYNKGIIAVNAEQFGLSENIFLIAISFIIATALLIYFGRKKVKDWDRIS